GRLTSPGIDRLVADVEEAQAGRTLAAAQLLLHIATTPSAEPSLDTVLKMTLDRLADIVEFSRGSVSLIEGETLKVRASNGSPRRSTSGPRNAQGKSPTRAVRRIAVVRARGGRVIRELRPMRVDNVRRRVSTGSRPIRSWLGAPIVR